MTDAPTWEAAISDGVLRIRLRGRFDMESWRAVLFALSSTPGYRKDLTSIYDARDAAFDFTGEQIRELVADLAPIAELRGDRYRAAFVVGRDVDYGFSRMIQILCEHFPFEAVTFRSLDEAERWARAR